MELAQSLPLTNRQLVELLARKAEEADRPFFVKALRRAARRALSWPMQAASLWTAGEPLQQLPGIGPVLAKLLADWFAEVPPVPEPDPLRANFLTMAEALPLVEQLPEHWRPRGDLQMHTVWSDGSQEISDMADEARRIGYSYIGITDHAKALKIAGGMDEERLARQGEEIDHLNARLDGFRILKSLEVNLTPQGEMDMDGQGLDVVLACFHSKLRLKDDQTERYLAALRNPGLDILGHPRGRIFNFRSGLFCDWETVLAEAARLDKAVEIDCFPDRQDLDGATLELARQAGVRISLGTDAHAAHQLNFMPLGLAAAYRAGIPAERILNLMSADDLCEWAASHRL